MEKLEYSPHCIGKIMKNCWQKDPKERPTFLQLTKVIENFTKLNFSLDYWNSTGPRGKTVLELCDVGEMVEPTLSSQRIHNQGRGVESIKKPLHRW
jgi:hypothetical protein